MRKIVRFTLPLLLFFALSGCYMKIETPRRDGLPTLTATTAAMNSIVVTPYPLNKKGSP